VVKLSGEIYGALSSLATSVLVHLGRLVERYQPEVLTYIHQLQAFVHDFIVKASGMKRSSFLLHSLLSFLKYQIPHQPFTAVLSILLPGVWWSIRSHQL